MANLIVDWKAECEKCEKELGREFNDDRCPDRWDFDTERCEYCDEEVCKNCAGSRTDIHKKCEEDLKVEEEERAEEESAKASESKRRNGGGGE